MQSQMWPDIYLHTELVDLEERRACLVVCTAPQKLLGKPIVKAGIILFLQFVAVLADAVHVGGYGWRRVDVFMSATGDFCT